jgi:hypothetical protein
LVLSVYVARSMGPWVLAIGLMRYAFLVAGALPWMRVALPARYWRKVVAAAQGIVLTVVAADVVPRAWASAALVLALMLLVESFGRDVRWLVVKGGGLSLKHRRTEFAGSPVGSSRVPPFCWCGARSWRQTS